MTTLAAISTPLEPSEPDIVDNTATAPIVVASVQTPTSLSHKLTLEEIEATDLIVLQPNNQHKVVSNVPPRTAKELIDISSSDTYSILTPVPAWNKDMFDVDCIDSSTYKIAHEQGLVRKITLVDFPPEGTYTLQINMRDAAIATLVDGQMTFEIDSPTRSEYMSTMVRILYSRGEESVKDRSKYVNIARADSLVIKSSIPLESRHTIKLEGLFHEDKPESHEDKRESDGEIIWTPKVWTHKVIDYDIYPTEQRLSGSGPLPNQSTKEIVFFGTTDMNIRFRINGDLYGPFTSTNKIVRLGFEGFTRFDRFHAYTANCSKYLSDENNRTSIGLAAVDHIGVVAQHIDNELLPCSVKVMSFVHDTYDMSGLPHYSR